MPSTPVHDPRAIPAGPQAARDPALDGLRGVAILLVYLFHYGGGLTSSHPAVRCLGYLTQAGWVGVDIFFALSGFLITRLFWADREAPRSLGRFYARRCLRILPLYGGTLALSAVVATLDGAPLAALRPLLLYAGFLQNIPPLIDRALHYPPPLPLYHLWSLAVEEQFYLLWPVVLLLCRTRRGAFGLCLAGFGLCCVFRVAIWGLAPSLPGAPPLAWSIALPGRCGALALGGALALLPSAWGATVRRLAPLALALGLGGYLAVGIGEGGLLLNNAPCMTLGLPCVEVFAVALVACTVAGRTAPNRWRAVLGGRPLRALGRISYGFYLFHILLEPCFDAIGTAVTHAHGGMPYQVVRLLVAFPITIAVAALSYRLFELPFLRLKRRFSEVPPYNDALAPSMGGIRQR